MMCLVFVCACAYMHVSVCVNGVNTPVALHLPILSMSRVCHIHISIELPIYLLL